jgi:hypothetical protein
MRRSVCVLVAKVAFTKKKTLFTSRLVLNIRKKLMKCYVVLKLGHFGK